MPSRRDRKRAARAYAPVSKPTYPQRLVQRMENLRAEFEGASKERYLSLSPSMHSTFTQDKHGAMQGLQTAGSAQGRDNNAATAFRFLDLPAELRQMILYHTVDDDDLKSTTYKQHARRLKRVCPTIRADVHIVRDQWRKRHEEFQQERGQFHSYINELMAPLQEASKTLRRHKNLPGKNRARNKSCKQNSKRKEGLKMERVANQGYGSTSALHPGIQWGWPSAREEMEHVEAWKQRSKGAKAAWKHRVKESDGNYRTAYCNFANEVANTTATL